MFRIQEERSKTIPDSEINFMFQRSFSLQQVERCKLIPILMEISPGYIKNIPVLSAGIQSLRRGNRRDGINSSLPLSLAMDHELRCFVSLMVNDRSNSRNS